MRKIFPICLKIAKKNKNFGERDPIFFLVTPIQKTQCYSGDVRRDGEVVRVPALQSVDVGFIPFV